MVSQDFSEEPTSSALHQCLISNMETGTAHTEDVAYQLRSQSNREPICFNPLEEQINRAGNTPMGVMSGENSHMGVNYGHGYGLSLTLGSFLRTEYPKENMVCEDEINSSLYNASIPSNTAFNGMTSILTDHKSSPYLKPAQELLDEVVCVSNAVESGSSENQVTRSCDILMTDTLNQEEGDQSSLGEKPAVHVRITKLVALLEKLETRHEQYFHRMDTVVSSFEAVAGRGAAASYTALTIQAMSKHFSNLRDAIITQLNAARYSLSKGLQRNHGDLSSKSNRKNRETLQQLGMIQLRQVWRPLRGLPEESVSLLRSWLFEHFLHPYPTDNEKLMLASQTGLTRNQISNWFINARVRLWKPMIEEMYREEFSEVMQDSSS